MLVKVVKSSHSVFQKVFLKDNNLRFIRIDQRSFKVEQTRFFSSGEPFTVFLGEVFTKKSIWVFIPDRCADRPQTWYFGLTRSDAVSGYIDFLKSSGKKSVDNK